jgi:hypothetical protein
MGKAKLQRNHSVSKPGSIEVLSTEGHEEASHHPGPPHSPGLIQPLNLNMYPKLAALARTDPSIILA